MAGYSILSLSDIIDEKKVVQAIREILDLPMHSNYEGNDVQ